MTRQDLGNCCGGLDESELEELEAIAKLYLESNGLIIKLAGLVGRGAEYFRFTRCSALMQLHPKASHCNLALNRACL